MSKSCPNPGLPTPIRPRRSQTVGVVPALWVAVPGLLPRQPWPVVLRGPDGGTGLGADVDAHGAVAGIGGVESFPVRSAHAQLWNGQSVSGPRRSRRAYEGRIRGNRGRAATAIGIGTPR